MAHARISSIRAVLYLRMSTGRQETSIPDQRSALKDRAASSGYQIIGEYVDHAISGDDTAKRVGFQQMRDDAQAKKFDVILCWDQDRFGRFDPVEAGYWIKPIRDAGVRLETIAQGKIDWDDFAGRLLYMVQQEAKHAFLRDLSRNICRAQLQMAKDGRGTGGNRIPFGFRAETTRDSRGKVIDSRLVVQPEEAAIVKRIFAMYQKPGASLRGIATELNDKGIRSGSGKPWRQNVVRYVLRNQKYTGDFVWGQAGVGRYFTTCGGEIAPRNKRQRKVVGNPIIKKDNHAAIIDHETFERTQRRLRQQQQQRTPKRYRQYVLTGLLRCGDCGGLLAGCRSSANKEIHRYMCRSYMQSGKAACNCNSVAEAAFVESLRKKIEEVYFSDKMLESLRRRIRQTRQQATGKSDKDLQKPLKKRLSELDKAIDQGSSRLLQVPEQLVETVTAKLVELRQERDEISKQLEKLLRKASRSDEQEKNDATAALVSLESLRDRFAKASPAVIAEMFRDLIDRIEVSFEHRQNGKLRRSEFAGAVVYLRPDSECSQMVTTEFRSVHVRTFPAIRISRAELFAAKA